MSEVQPAREIIIFFLQSDPISLEREWLKSVADDLVCVWTSSKYENSSFFKVQRNVDKNTRIEGLSQSRWKDDIDEQTHFQ